MLVELHDNYNNSQRKGKRNLLDLLENIFESSPCRCSMLIGTATILAAVVRAEIWRSLTFDNNMTIREPSGLLSCHEGYLIPGGGWYFFCSFLHSVSLIYLIITIITIINCIYNLQTLKSMLRSTNSADLLWINDADCRNSHSY